LAVVIVLKTIYEEAFRACLKFPLLSLDMEWPMCQMCCMSELKETVCSTSLNMVLRNLILTAVHWSRTSQHLWITVCEPWLVANHISSRKWPVIFVR
jgi:hypothetical protein